MTRWSAAMALLARFVWQVMMSGVDTARIVLRRGPPPVAGLIRIRFAPMSEQGAALLACLVTLTPGTTVLDIDMARREMLLHLLDLSGSEAARATIRAEFERFVVRLFPERGRGS